MSRPGIGATPAPSRMQLSRWLLGVARPVLGPWFASLAMRCVALVAGIVLLGWGAAAIVAAVGGAGPTWLALAAVMVALSLLKAVARYLEQFFGHLVAFKALALLRNYFYDRLEPQAPAGLEGRRTGDLLSRATKDIDRVEVFFAHTLAPAITAAVVPLGVSGWLMAYLSPVAGLVALLGWVVIGAVVPLIGARASLAAARRLRVTRGRVAQHVTDTVQGVREVLAFDAEERRSRELGVLEREIGADLEALGRWQALRRGINAAAVLVTAAVVFATGAAAVTGAAPGVTWGTVVVAVVVVIATMPAVLAVEEFASDLDQAFAAAGRVYEVTEATPATAQPSAPADVTALLAAALQDVPSASAVRGLTVTLSDVHFAYPLLDAAAAAGSAGPAAASAVDDRRASHAGPTPTPEPAPAGRAEPSANGPERPSANGPEVIHGVSLTIAAGQTTALVGVSGSGKSTIGSLIARFYDPTAGTVTIGRDGQQPVDVRELADADLRRLVSVVSQRPYLFHDTVAANLAVARPDATDAELTAALAHAQLAEFVASLPDGRETVIGEQGERLSGGQRQRLAIARALLRDTPVIVLDEVTSQLDPATQAELTAALDALTRDRTVVLIAHRLESLRKAHRVVVIDAGRVVQDGSFDDLAAVPGPLHTLISRKEIS